MVPPNRLIVTTWKYCWNRGNISADRIDSNDEAATTSAGVGLPSHVLIAPHRSFLSLLSISDITERTISICWSVHLTLFLLRHQWTWCRSGNCLEPQWPMTMTDPFHLPFGLIATAVFVK